MPNLLIDIFVAQPVGQRYASGCSCQYVFVVLDPLIHLATKLITTIVVIVHKSAAVNIGREWVSKLSKLFQGIFFSGTLADMVFFAIYRGSHSQTTVPSVHSGLDRKQGHCEGDVVGYEERCYGWTVWRAL